jgi:hypothetical protein
MMASYMNVGKSKKYQQTMRDVAASTAWRPKTYLDSGIFTFMRRAQVVYQPVVGKIRAKGPASRAEFEEFARTFIEYVESADARSWDYIVELDVDELPEWGVERADKFRRYLHGALGDRLLPVWHAQRGLDGWREMIRTFPYVCLSPTKVFNRSGRADGMIAGMIADAHAAGCDVHILGVETVKWFELGSDSIDASSWTAGARFGEFKLGNSGRGPAAVSIPAKDGVTKGGGRARGRRWHHSRILQFEDMLTEWGYTVDDLKDAKSATMVGIKLLQTRQEEARRVRKNAQAVG